MIVGSGSLEAAVVDGSGSLEAAAVVAVVDVPARHTGWWCYMFARNAAFSNFQRDTVDAMFAFGLNVVMIS